MNFELNLQIDPADLEVINSAQQKIALAKPVSGSKTDVIWLAFDAFEANSVQWTEDYWLYASTASVSTHGEKITKLSEVQPGPAMDGNIYPFSNNATFGEPQASSDVSVGSYAATNNMGYGKYPALTFGLSQSAQVNQKPEERKPISASSVLATQSITVTPFTTVYVWLESHVESSTIITDVIGQRATAKFGGGVDSITMKYDGKSGLFHQ